MAKELKNVVTIDNIGPIEHLEIPLIPGVVVLRGHIGAGKTTAISAIGTLATGKGKLSKRDGVLTAGKIKGCGVTLTVNQRSTRAGTLEVECIEDRLSLVDLVDPKVADALAADAKRIKALVSLSGVEASLAMFSGAISGHETAIGVEAKTAIDPLAMARLIKRDLESAARLQETEAEELAAKINAASDSIANVDMSGETDERKLSQAHTAAVQAEATLKAQAAAAKTARESAAVAAAKLDAAKNHYTGPSKTEAEAAFAAAEKVAEDAKKAVEDAKHAIRVAQESLAKLERECDKDIDAWTEAKVALDSAKAHADFVAAAETATVSPPEGPTEDQIEEAGNRVGDASAAISRGVEARRAIDAKNSIAAWESSLSGIQSKAKSLRAAAQGVESQLTKCLSFDGFAIVEGRLAVTTKRGQTYIADLSTGERAKWALGIAAAAAGANNLVPIPQEMWQSLNPSEQAAIAQMLAAKGVTGVAAAVSDGELRAELFSK